MDSQSQESVGSARRRPRPAVDYPDSYFPAANDDYYYDDEYEDIYAAVQYQKALARKRAKAAQQSMRDVGKEAAEKAQAANIAARRHELSGESPAKPKSLQISSDQVNDPEWQEDIGRRMLEDLGRGLVPNLEGLGALVEQARGLKGDAPSDATTNAKTTSSAASAASSN